MSKTNLGLVKWAEKALNERWGYVWGTFGQKLTSTLLKQKINQYPSGVGRYENFIRNNYMGRNVADCVGLIKGYYWERNGKIAYNSSTDINANMMYSRATKKGSINTIPEIPGLCVWRKGHIGVYIGNGVVIEAQGTKYGVRKNRLRDRNFTHWLECPYIDYVKDEVAPEPIEVDLKTGVTKISIDNRDIVLRSIHEVGEGLTQFIALRDLECLGFEVKWMNGVTNIWKNNQYRRPNLNIDYIIKNIAKSNVEIMYNSKLLKLDGYSINNDYDGGKMQFIKVRDLEEFGYVIGWDNNKKQVTARR